MTIPSVPRAVRLRSDWLVWLIAFGLCLVAVALSEVAPGFTFVWRSLLALMLAILFRQWRIQLLRPDLPPGPGLGSPLDNGTRRLAWVTLAFALVFQATRWLAESGAIRSMPGEDDETYIFLAFQVLGYSRDVPIVFALRPPGWPLIMAVLLQVFGGQQVWVVGVYHRLILALACVAIYLILARFLTQPAAMVGALFSLTLPYNGEMASAAMTDVTYAVLLVLAMAASIESVEAGRPVVWLLLAGALLAIKAMVRLSGIGVVLGFVIAVLWIGRLPLQQRLIRAGLLASPVLASLLALGVYHQSVAGRFVIPTGTGFGILWTYGALLPERPDTLAFTALATLIPEVKPEDAFKSPNHVIAVQYRYVKAGYGDLLDFYGSADAAGKDLVAANRLSYVVQVSRGAIVMLMHPRHGILPPAWRLWRYDLYADDPAYASNPFGDDYPHCPGLSFLDPAWGDRWCEPNRRLRDWLVFEPAGLEDVPNWLTWAAHLLTISLPYRLLGLGWPFIIGIAGFAALAYLFYREPTRWLAVLLGWPALAEFSQHLLAAGGIETRYLLVMHPLYLIATWLALAFLFQNLLASSSGAWLRRSSAAPQNTH